MFSVRGKCSISNFRPGTPNYINAFINKGESLKSLGRSKEALEEYIKALEVEPNNQDSLKRKEELEITKR